MVETQLSLFLKNKPGVLADVCKTLTDYEVNIRGMSVSDTVDHAVVRLVVDNPQKASHSLGEHGVLVVETDVLQVNLANKPGELAKIARKLARGKVNIEYAYGTSNGAQATIYLRVSDTKKGLQVLSPGKRTKKKKVRR
jgi:hypothetical protein